MRYLAVLYPAAEGGYAVEFPDFPEALTQGDTLDEAIDMATDALGIVVEEYAKARRDLPAPSTLEQVKAVAMREMATARGVDHSREPFFQLIPAPEVDMTPVKISVSFARSVLAGIDAKAKQRGMTRSGFLAAAAQAF
ncbi:type II toxin-antitoxin system HicB family antitoxin [uncultured Desulfovibrio sp.]|uniref:type II toxin-antitoxin system HicB family antitoxin n=1 Tax=uncultured Desulfovibrio sp. TaxID=167968 RepID=UPI002601A1E9|nr:type II toxin-antitoxin system HicB family antitoxin [uncultured Desulfovibrio sp.]